MVSLDRPVTLLLSTSLVYNSRLDLQAKVPSLSSPNFSMYYAVYDGEKMTTLLKVDAPSETSASGSPIAASSDLSISRLSTASNVDATGTSVESIDEDSDSDSDDDSAAYVSFDSDSDVDQAEDPVAAEERKAEYHEREAERARVLEAAGLVLAHDPSHAPPVPPRRKRSLKAKSPKSRRAPPPVPDITTPRERSPANVERDLPPTPTSPRESILHSENDAWTKYELFKRSSSGNTIANTTNRLSIASAHSDAPSSPRSTTAPGLSPTTTLKDIGSHPHQTSKSFFNNFLGRATSAASGSTERRTAPLIISGPIGASSDLIARAPSPAFGSVSGILRFVMRDH